MSLPQLPSRRELLRLGFRTLSSAGAAAALGQLGRVRALAQSSGDYRALVCVFLFGGNDANNLLVAGDSAGYANYQKLRQNLAIPQGSLVPITDAASGAAYGLHPALAPLAPLYNTSKRLAVVANVGTLVQPVPRGADGLPRLSAVPLPLNLYSHSDQQAEWQSALAQGGSTSGWSGRLVDKAASTAGGLLPAAITLSGNVLQLVGEATQPSTVSTSNFALVAPATDPGSVALEQMSRLPHGSTLVQAAQRTLRDAMTAAQTVNSALGSSASLGVNFPNSEIGAQLAQVAQLIQIRQALGATRQVFFCSHGGYDTHSNQLTAQAALLSSLAAALAAFDQAMTALDLQRSVTTFTESDFGRTFQPNGNAGTDHGWGSHALVMGGAVNGGRIHGTFPQLSLAGPDDSTGRGTWVPSTSLDQYVGALARWFGLAQADLDAVFPNLRAFGSATLGLFG